jgi:hypothetical protein
MHRKTISFIFYLFLISSCAFKSEHSFFSSFSSKDDNQRSPWPENDYIDHFSYLKNVYLQSKSSRLVGPSLEENKYLQEIVGLILEKNRDLFEKIDRKDIYFYIIEDTSAFYFSFPGGHIFLSTGLLQRHIRYEGDFLSLITYELIKSLHRIYTKTSLIPFGPIDTQRMIALAKIPYLARLKIHELSYKVLKRIGQDPHVILYWIQQLNKKSVDFYFMRDEIDEKSREEYDYRNLLLAKNKKIHYNQSFFDYRSSSSRFLKMLEHYRKGYYANSDQRSRATYKE